MIISIPLLLFIGCLVGFVGVGAAVGYMVGRDVKQLGAGGKKQGSK